MTKTTHPSKHVIAVASKNPVKLSAARNAFAQVFTPEYAGFFDQCKQWLKDTFDPETITVLRASVPSLVSEQPTTMEETEQGARNRLHAIREQFPEAEAWVAIEGGVILRERSVIEVGCIIVAHKECPHTFMVEVPRFAVAHQTALRIRAGKEMGPANDEVFGQTNSKQAGGMAGIITDQLVIRYDLYYMPLLIAFSQVKNAHLYNTESIASAL